MKKKKEDFIEEKSFKNTIVIDYTIISNMEKKIENLEQTLKEIRKITERTQYGKPEISLRLIKEKINEIIPKESEF